MKENYKLALVKKKKLKKLTVVTFMRKIIKVYFDKCLSVPEPVTQFGFF